MLARRLSMFFRPTPGLTRSIDRHFAGGILQCTDDPQLQQRGPGSTLPTRLFGPMLFQSPDLSQRQSGIYSVGYKPWNRAWTP